MSKKQVNEEQIPTVDEAEAMMQEQVDETVANSEDAAQAKLEEALAEAAKQKDLALRTLAEMENLKRRTRIDVESAHKFGLEKFVKALIPVMDSMEMGLEASKKEEASIESIQEGLDMTLKQMLDMLDQFNVERINPVGEKFDPKTAEALTMVPSPDHESNTVIEVIQKGYMLNDRLVRSARVIVAQ